MSGTLTVNLVGAESPLMRRVRDVLAEAGYDVLASDAAGRVRVLIDDSHRAIKPSRKDLIVCRPWSAERCNQWLAAGAADCVADDDASLADVPALLRAIARRPTPVADAESTVALGTLLDHTGTLVGWVDASLHYRQVSPALAKFDGRSRSAYAGSLISELSPWAGATVVKLLQRVLANHEPVVNVDLRFRPSATSPVEKACTAGFYPILGHGNAVLGVGIAIVPTPVDAAEIHPGLEAPPAAKSIGVCSAWLDEAARFTGGDDVFQTFTGYPAEELTSLTIRDIIHPKDLRADTALFDWLMSGTGTFTVEHRWVRKGGATVPVRMALSRDGDDRSATVAVLDLSEIRHTQDLLRRSVAEAESAIAAKDRFLAVLSHELRTPLTPVLASVMAIEKDPTFPTELQAPFDLIRRNVELEARLIDDLLDLTRLSKGSLQLNLETVCLHTLLKQAVELCQHDAATKAVHLSIALDAERHHVRADAARLKQVFWNLVRNAIKFTPSGGTVAVKTVDLPGDHIQVIVVDTGIGMEPEAVGRVFSAFEQGEKTVSRQFGGLGLGLTISKALVERHGGTLTVDSPGKHRGTTFSTMLKTTPSPVPAPPTPASGSSSSPTTANRVRVLIVEDHEDTVRAMKRLLERVGYEVNAKSTVREAVEAVAATPYDVLISDIGLPDGSGMDLIRQVRHGGSAIRAIAISGFGMEDDVRRSKEAGFQEHLTKPVNFARLQQIIANLTGATSKNV